MFFICYDNSYNSILLFVFLYFYNFNLENVAIRYTLYLCFSLPYFINGCIYVWSYEKTRDIKVPIVAHISFNSFVFLAKSLY
ncbi:CPBP family glutamic-type intramembrane protease [Bacillus thuringiensis]|uniref:CPBP family glutamic-type intramembrane protease n=1 Tax=Bacillus thuringiensis TaxID=1428 RepID=UPI001A9FAABA|nr:CPBP family glutamic-type intramembrane protease [Bacillus thuringiensis]